MSTALIERLSKRRLYLIERALSPAARSSGFDQSRQFFEEAARIAYIVEKLQRREAAQ